jgi:hypothetical protein
MINLIPFTRQGYVEEELMWMYKVVRIWLGLIVCKQVTVCLGHIWTTLYKKVLPG